MKIEVSDEDLWTMLLSTVRYAMGRMTYMTSVAPELVLKFRDRLGVAHLTQIRNEVARALEIHEQGGTTLGMEMDHVAWKKFVNELTKAINENNR